MNNKPTKSMKEVFRLHTELVSRFLDAGYKILPLENAEVWTRTGSIMHDDACLYRKIKVDLTGVDGVEHWTYCELRVVIVDYKDTFREQGEDYGVNFCAEIGYGTDHHVMVDKGFMGEDFSIEAVEKLMVKIVRAVS
jgi:hypothetical protein